MEEKLIKNIETKLNEVIDHIDGNSADFIYKLVKTRHIVKEDECMNYNDYGRRYGNYNEYNDYGRRGRDAKYRGYGHLDRMYDDYGRYEDSRERYGAGAETDKSHRYMVESLKDFIKYLYETSETPQQKQMLREAIQQSMM